jgi:hypothetical protein
MGSENGKNPQAVRRRARIHKIASLAACAALAVIFAACGDDDATPTTPLQFQGPPEPAETEPAPIGSTSGCALDSDCAAGRHCFQGQCAYECDEATACSGDAVCTDRGRCVAAEMVVEQTITPAPVDDDAGGAADAGATGSADAGVTVVRLAKDFVAADIRTDLAVTAAPKSVFQVEEGQQEVVFAVDLNAPAPENGLPYRVERSDDPDASSKIHRTAGGDTRVEFHLPTGLADAALEESSKVRVKLVTPVGDFTVAMVPERPISGTYVGTAVIETFGRTGLPIDFQIATRPDGASLQEAEKVWLLLPVGPERLFSPLSAPDGSVEYVARELVYDDFVQRWVATYQMAFDLSGNQVVSVADAEQVRRSLRFEIEPFEGDRVIGEFTDIWTGLYEVRSADGVTRLQDVQYTGNLELRRIGSAPSHTEVEVVEYPDAQPALLPAPPLDQCGGGAFFDVPAVDLGEPGGPDEFNYNCAGIEASADFEAADSGAQASCAMAVAADALSGQTTGGMISAYLDADETNDGSQSFAEFMEECAAGTDGTCRPTPEVLCSRQLLAYAYRNQADDAAHIAALVAEYAEVTREAYLGQALGAFGADAKLRLEWLKTTDYPAVVVSAVQSLNQQLLSDWKEKVLDVHIGVLKGQFDPSGLAVLSRQVESGAAADAREQMLNEMTQGWRGAMDSLTLAATRWHTLLQGDAERAARRDYVSARMFDLYLSAGILKNLNLAADAGYLSARLGGGFAGLLRELGKLSMPFNELVYARDAEVVVNTSIDPLSGNDTLLSEREADALAEISRAHDSVLSVIERAQAEALSETQLRDRMNNEINDLRDTLVQMCGLPVGCTAADFRGDPQCHVRVAAGKCGFSVDKETNSILSFGAGQQSVSEAGRALLNVVEAAQNVRIADEELRALVQRGALQYEELQVFAAKIQEWNRMRLDGVAALEANIQQRQDLRNETVAKVLDSIAQQAALRKAGIESQRETFAKWNQIRMENATIEIGLLIASNTARTAANGLRHAAEAVSLYKEAALEGFPKVVGASADVSAPGRLALSMAAASTTLGMRAAAVGFDVVAAGLEIGRQSFQLIEAAEMAALQDDAALGAAISADQLATLKEEAVKAEKLSQVELARLKEIIELAQAYRAAELAHERDLDTFRQRRLDLRQKLTSIAGLELRVLQAGLQYRQAVAEYLGVAQRAALKDAKLRDLLRQRANVNQLVGSPAVIFGRANRLAQAELRLERAKVKLMDWLVALEYYAVRPFMEQRQAILLARNTYQLEKIAEELRRLEQNCGGATNDVTSVISVRRDLLGLTHSVVDPVTGETLSPEERFRRILQRGYVPIDKRVRYSSDDTVGSLMSRDPSILSATFFIDLSDFANLELTCNAKVASLAVKLIGELGDARATASILYDGTSKLRSCQPGIDEYVAQFGPDTTSYGSITHLRTAGRSMSPVSGINEFPGEPGQASQTFAGLPLASQYTLLINTEAGENRDLDWSKLEDVELRLTYSYQDIFPAGQCE